MFLNHFYVVLDAETYAAIDSSSFLHDEFAPFERRTTVRTDRTYTGIYFYGTNTYFEFFDGSKQTRFRQGVGGLALSPERSGALEALHRQIESDPPQLITRKFGDAQVPWFTMLEPKGLSSDASVDPWLMEYHPRFLAEWHPELSRGEDGIRRGDILRRYRAVLASVPPAPYLRDVREITFAADADTVARMRILCTGFGYRSTSHGDELTLEGPEIVLRFVPATGNRQGILRVVLEVDRAPKGQREFRFGSSVLRFEKGGRAVWEF